MKYKDYLIVPVLAMYLLYASCAYIAKDGADAAEPEPSVNPSDITWSSSGDEAEYWYADGRRGTECFYVVEGQYGAGGICFSDGSRSDDRTSNYVISNMHLKCSGGSGESHDLIFLNEVTAYDTVSGTYYKRADYEDITGSLVSGKFVNSENPKDYYIFKKNGKSAEYFGDKVFKGKWSLDTAESLTVYDYSCRQDFRFGIVTDPAGGVAALKFNDTVYNLVA